ncbi:HAD family hydrolase, partial [Deinococcus pimensis]|uniref:HAD family hydrolase n=1 Tax=Deinococcus pimensis TaxID=309888 RepID=UPI000483B44D
MSVRADYGLIFDMDGVLADTVEPHYRSWQRLADEEGLPFTRADNPRLLGRTRRDALGLFVGERALTEAEAQGWMERKNRYFLEAIEDMGPADTLPGVTELLREARAAGVPLAVASS